MILGYFDSRASTIRSMVVFVTAPVVIIHDDTFVNEN